MKEYEEVVSKMKKSLPADVFEKLESGDLKPFMKYMKSTMDKKGIEDAKKIFGKLLQKEGKKEEDKEKESKDSDKSEKEDEKKKDSKSGLLLK